MEYISQHLKPRQLQGKLKSIFNEEHSIYEQLY